MPTGELFLRRPLAAWTLRNVRYRERGKAFPSEPFVVAAIVRRPIYGVVPASHRHAHFVVRRRLRINNRPAAYAHITWSFFLSRLPALHLPRGAKVYRRRGRFIGSLVTGCFPSHSRFLVSGRAAVGPPHTRLRAAVRTTE